MLWKERFLFGGVVGQVVHRSNTVQNQLFTLTDIFALWNHMNNTNNMLGNFTVWHITFHLNTYNAITSMYSIKDNKIKTSITAGWLVTMQKCAQTEQMLKWPMTAQVWGVFFIILWPWIRVKIIQTSINLQSSFETILIPCLKKNWKVDKCLNANPSERYILYNHLSKGISFRCWSHKLGLVWCSANQQSQQHI